MCAKVKKQGGLGVLDLENMNTILLLKWLVRFQYANINENENSFYMQNMQFSLFFFLRFENLF
jgi:hypothetical protein